jgi:3-oxoadipate enol-lactonase
MLLPLAGRRLYYDLVGPEDAPVLAITHSLASDSGMWAEQLPALLQAGWRVLRLDMRGHGGSDPVAGDYTMSALAQDVAAALDALSLPRVHYLGLSIGGMIGQAFALEHGNRLISAMWCDTLPASPESGAPLWEERMNTVRRAGSVEPLADATMERWFTDAFKPQKPRRWQEIRDTVAATSPAGYLGCSAAIMDFDFTACLPALRLPCLVVCGAEDPGTPPSENRRIADLVPGARYEQIPSARHFPNVERPDPFNRIMLGWLDTRRGER